MKNSTIILLLAAAAMLALSAGPFAGSGTAADYMGVVRCKTCHNSKKMGGEQYKIWEKSRHANALNTLKELGEADNPKCLKCHTTGYGEPVPSGVNLAGVQCEACHGPGSIYKSVTIMSKKAYKENRAAAHKKALDAGLVMPPTEKVCRGCHNEESPNFKGFDFEADKEKIKHWD